MPLQVLHVGAKVRINPKPHLRDHSPTFWAGITGTVTELRPGDVYPCLVSTDTRPGYERGIKDLGFIEEELEVI